MGSRSEFQAAMRAASMSTTVTWMSGALSAITAIVGPPTKPAPMQQIFMRVCYECAHRRRESKADFACRSSQPGGDLGGHLPSLRPGQRILPGGILLSTLCSFV
jgi:hypothetical protein